MEEMHMEETRKPTRKPRAPAAAKPAAKPAPAKARPTARQPAAKASTPPQGPTPAEREDMIRTAAYFRARNRGFSPGYEWEDWLAAEAEIGAMIEPAPAAKPRKATPRK
jgi:hypothetical protein